MATSVHHGVVAGPIVTALAGASGSVRCRVTPTSNADPASGDEQCILDLGDVAANLELIWQGIVGGGEYAYLAAVVAGVEVARFYTYHLAGDTLDVQLRWGGTPTRVHLVVNGCAITHLYSVLPGVVATNKRVTVGSERNTTTPQNPYVPALRPFDGAVSRVVCANWRQDDHVYWAALGDSLTQEPNTAALRSWSRRFGALAGERGYILNAGQNGDQVSSLIARVQSEVIDQAPTTCVVLVGINDIVAGLSAAQIEADLTTLYGMISGAGIRIVACTILPFGNAAQYTAPREAVRSAVNTWLRTYPAGVDAVVDLAASMLTPASDPATLLAAYDGGDGLHCSQAGYDHIGDAVWALAADVTATAVVATRTLTGTGVIATRTLTGTAVTL